MALKDFEKAIAAGKYQSHDHPDFHFSLARVQGENGLWGILDDKGREILPCVYQDIAPFYGETKKDWGTTEATTSEGIVIPLSLKRLKEYGCCVSDPTELFLSDDYLQSEEKIWVDDRYSCYALRLKQLLGLDPDVKDQKGECNVDYILWVGEDASRGLLELKTSPIDKTIMLEPGRRFFALANELEKIVSESYTNIALGYYPRELYFRIIEILEEFNELLSGELSPLREDIRGSVEYNTAFQTSRGALKNIDIEEWRETLIGGVRDFRKYKREQIEVFIDSLSEISACGERVQSLVNTLNQEWICTIKRAFCIHLWSAIGTRVHDMYTRLIWYRHKSALDKITKSNQVLYYSHLAAGWYKKIFTSPNNPDYRLLMDTNFGFGRSSYWHTWLSYRGVLILPYSEFINYAWHVWSDRPNMEIGAKMYKSFTRKYELSRCSWDEALGFLVTTCNGSRRDPSGFIKDFIRKELDLMVSRLSEEIQEPRCSISIIVPNEDMTNSKGIEGEAKDINLFTCAIVCQTLSLVSSIEKLSEIGADVSAWIENLVAGVRPICQKILGIKPQLIKENQRWIEQRDAINESPKQLLWKPQSRQKSFVKNYPSTFQGWFSVRGHSAHMDVPAALRLVEAMEELCQSLAKKGYNLPDNGGQP